MEFQISISEKFTDTHKEASKVSMAFCSDRNLLFVRYLKQTKKEKIKVKKALPCDLLLPTWV